jgi:hypothetical protein
VKCCMKRDQKSTESFVENRLSYTRKDNANSYLPNTENWII